MRKGIILGIGILIILLALAGTGSAHPSYYSGGCSPSCHSSGFNGTFFNNTHKFNGISVPTVDGPNNNCDKCHSNPPADMSLTLIGQNYSIKHNGMNTSGYINSGANCTYCHLDPVGLGNFTLLNAATYFKQIHKFNGVAIPNKAIGCTECHKNVTSFLPLVSNGLFYNSTHRYNSTTLASVKLIGTTGCANCHNNTPGGNFSLISGAGTNLTSDTCVYCHTKLVDDWNVSKHSPSNATCVICHNVHNAGKVVTTNTTCLNLACHGTSKNPTTRHSYNLTQCKNCHMPKVLTVNLSTPFDTRSHTFDFRTQLKSNASDERHEAVFNTLKNVTTYNATTLIEGNKTSCEKCHGSKDIPSVNFKAAYRASKHNDTANGSAPYCTDCHKTANTTEAKLINETTCKTLGCHNGITHINATKISSIDCVKCHFNNSDTLRTHDLTFATVSNISYTCTICHVNGTNKSVAPEIVEWKATAHNDKQVGVNKSRSYNGYYFNNTSQTLNKRENSCNKCHSPLDWDPTIAESVTTKVQLTANFKGIVCTICHNKDDMVNWIKTNNKVYAWYNRDAIQVSSSEIRAKYELMDNTTELCGNCHSNIRYGNTGPGWGATSSSNPTGVISPHGFPAKDVFVGSWKESGLLKFECIDCHIYKNTTYGNGTMSDSLKVTGHSFEVNGTHLQSKSECAVCHVDGTSVGTIEDVIVKIQNDTQTKWNSTNITVMNAFNNITASQEIKNLSRDKIAEAYWDLKLVSSDESWGVHDPVGTNKLLDDAAALAISANASLGQAETSNVDLAVGWNLVSLNGTPADTTPSSVMNSVKDNITVVWGYNATGSKWELYDPVMPTALNTLKSMVQGKGYWISATKVSKWTV